MGLNRSEKESVLEGVSAHVAKSQSIILAEYRGLGVVAITGLRKQAREKGVHLQVVKNTLARRAVEGTPYAKLSDSMVGPLLYGFSDDPVSAAKVLSDFAKANDKLVIKAGAMPNSVLTTDGIKALATLPSREELLAKLCGTLQAPITKFVQTLNEVPAKFVRALAAVQKQKEEQAPAAVAAPAEEPAAAAE